MKNIDNVGGRLKKLLEENNISFYGLSQKINVGHNTLSDIVTKNRTPNERTRNAICNYFNVSEEWLMNGVYNNFDFVNNVVVDFVFGNDVDSDSKKMIYNGSEVGVRDFLKDLINENKDTRDAMIEIFELGLKHFLTLKKAEYLKRNS